MPRDVREMLIELDYDPFEQMKFMAQNLRRIADNFKTYMNI